MLKFRMNQLSYSTGVLNHTVYILIAMGFSPYTQIFFLGPLRITAIFSLKVYYPLRVLILSLNACLLVALLLYY